MRKHLFFKVAEWTGLFGVVMTISFPPSAVGQGPVDIVERLRLLNERIDSLEVEKQKQKRLGQPIVELDTKTALLKDSIGELRIHLQKDISPNGRSSEQGGNKNVGLKSIAFFDGILIAAGGVTVLFLIILLAVIYRAKVRRRIATVQKRPAIIKVKPLPKGRGPGATAAPMAVSANERRSSDSNPLSPETVEKSGDDAESQPLGSSMPPLKDSLEQSKNRNDLVIQAEREGLSIKEISLKFHLSVDQVALILTMAKKK